MPLKVAFMDWPVGGAIGVIGSLLRQISPWPVELTHPKRADLIVLGSHPRRLRTRLRIALSQPSDTRRSHNTLRGYFVDMDALMARDVRPLVLFATDENLSRFRPRPCDFMLCSELPPRSIKAFRYPYWMEVLDWRFEGLHHVIPKYLSRPLEIERLMAPLGNAFLDRPRRATLFTTHLNEPRRSLLSALNAIVPVDGYGRAFNPEVQHFFDGKINKSEILRQSAFNLCPENSLYPGYYTEKVPQAFEAGCLPIGWCDPNVSVDFNPNAFINLLPFAAEGYEGALQRLLDPGALEPYADEPLLRERPSLEPLRDFLKSAIGKAR